MKALLPLGIILAVLTTSPVIRADDAAEQEQVCELEKRCSAALVRGDIPFLASFYADDWVLIGCDGQRYSRQQTLTWLSLGKVKWNSCEYGEMDIRIFGNTAIAIYRATALGEVQGARIEETEICSDIFIRVDEGWRCVHSHNCQVR
jgi:ketosteroid isomerase-like protein